MHLLETQTLNTLFLYVLFRAFYNNQSAFPTNAHHLLHEIFTILAYMFRSHGPSSGQLYKEHRGTVTYYTYKPCLWCVVD